jgi:hypothetical protein
MCDPSSYGRKAETLVQQLVGMAAGGAGGQDSMFGEAGDEAGEGGEGGAFGEDSIQGIAGRRGGREGRRRRRSRVGRGVRITVGAVRRLKAGPLLFHCVVTDPSTRTQVLDNS